MFPMTPWIHQDVCQRTESVYSALYGKSTVEHVPSTICSKYLLSWETISPSPKGGHFRQVWLACQNSSVLQVFSCCKFHMFLCRWISSCFHYQISMQFHFRYVMSVCHPIWKVQFAFCMLGSLLRLKIKAEDCVSLVWQFIFALFSICQKHGERDMSLAACLIRRRGFGGSKHISGCSFPC